MAGLTSNLYFLVRWLCIGIVRSFFKDVAILHPERIPLYGPAIFVGNHNNQFMDASMLVANIPRQVHFLVALKSMKRHVVGFLCRLSGCIPVDRQDDRAFTGQGAARISHHFTEEDHVCPLPPHHHHHHRNPHSHSSIEHPRPGSLSSREDGGLSLARSSSSPAVEGGDYAAPAKNEDNNGGAMMTANSGGEGGGAGGGSSSSSAGTTPGHVSGARTPAEGDERKGREREKEAEDSKGVLGTKEGGGEEGEEAGSEKRPHRVENSHELHGSDNNVHPILSPRQKDGGGYGDHEKLQLTSALIPPLPHEQTPTTPWSREGGGSTARDVEGGEGRSSVSFPRASPRGHGSSTEGVAVGAMKSPALRFEASPPSSRAGRGGGGHHRSETGPALRTMPSSASSASPTQMTVSILGESTRFTAEVRPGHKIRLEGKDYTVLKVFSDTHLLAKPPSDLPLRTIGSSPAPTAPASRCTSVPRVGSEPLIAGAASRDRDRTPVIGKIVRAESAREAGRVSRSAAMAGVSRDKKKKRSGGGGGEEEEEAQSDSSGGGERWVGVCPDRGASFSSRSSSCSGSSASITYNGQSDSHVDAMRGGEGEEEAQDGERGEEEGKGQEKRMGAGGDWKKGHESSSSTEWGQDDQSRRSGTAHRDAASSFHPSLDGEKGGKDEEASRALRELGEEGLRRRRGKAGGERGEEETKRGEPQRWGGGGGGGGREEDKDDLIRPLHYRHHHDHDQQRRRLHEKQRKLSAVSYHPYKILPKVDQREVYEAVSQSLVEGDCIGIFPEGGSHDRTTLLPLKAGVAIMALQGLAAGAEDVMIVPVGLIYHNPHKTQSRATIHIGDPIPVSRELAIEYQHDRRAATSRILTNVEMGLRSCIITAQDHETMSLIRLCCSLYPPERLRLSPEKFFNLNQLLSKLFWRCADELDLLKLRKDLAAYQGALQRAGVPDHDVWMLKQSTAGASLIFSEKLIAFLYATALGVPLLPLWGPLRVIAYILAERHRAKALAASAVKLKGTDVVASYKMIVLLVCVPLFNLIYGALFGLIFRKSLWETFVSMVLCVCLLPVLYYVSMRRAERILPLLRQMRTLILVVIGKVNIWRENERELITQRMEMQFLVRETLFTLGPRTSATFMDELYAIVPKAVLHADINRLLRKKEDFAPLQMKSLMNNAEEIL